MIKVFQKLTRLSGRDRFETTLWVLGFILAPIEILSWLAVAGFTRSFSGALQNGVSNRFEDPVYKKNLQRLIERNRQFEEERNERHS
jgi:hypothetical protein